MSSLHAAQARTVHGLLTGLSLVSPFGDVLAAEDRARRLQVRQHNEVELARRRREEIANAVVDGADLTDELLEQYRGTQLWHADRSVPSVASVLVEHVLAKAIARTAHALVKNAGPIFDLVSGEAAAEVDKIRRLPRPPHGLWGSANPARDLALAPGHEGTLSVVALVQARLVELEKVAAVVRQPAGHGPERLTVAPRWALSVRNWEDVADRLTDARGAHPTVRLWWKVVDGWEVGIWKPSEVNEPRMSFGERLSKLGAAVG